jgi:hypothetical protein
VAQRTESYLVVQDSTTGVRYVLTVRDEADYRSGLTKVVDPVGRHNWWDAETGRWRRRENE